MNPMTDLPPYSCYLYETWRMKDGEYKLTRHILLPFVPVVGMTLYLGNEDDSFCPHAVDYFVHETESAFWLYEVFDDCGCQCKKRDECCVVGSGPDPRTLALGWELFGEIQRWPFRQTKKKSQRRPPATNRRSTR